MDIKHKLSLQDRIKLSQETEDWLADQLIELQKESSKDSEPREISEIKARLQFEITVKEKLRKEGNK